MPQQRDPTPPFPIPARHHDAGFELDRPVAREDGAPPAVEERVVFEERDGVGGGREGGGAAREEGAGRAVDVQEGGGVEGVGGRWEVGAGDGAGAAVDDEAGGVGGVGGGHGWRWCWEEDSLGLIWSLLGEVENVARVDRVSTLLRYVPGQYLHHGSKGCGCLAG